MKHVPIIESGKIHNIPERYLPKTLSKRDSKTQLASLRRSRKSYKKGVYISRPKLASFVGKPSPHVATARRLYGVENMRPSTELANRSGCSISGMRQIISKGRGAYFSSGSRPSQTADSWAYARLASALTGGPAACVDYSILEKTCKPTSRAMSLAKRACSRTSASTH